MEIERARAKEFYDHAPIGLLTLDEAGFIVEANLSAAALLEFYARDELLGRPFSGIILPADGNVLTGHLRRLAETGITDVCELRLLKKGGTWFWASLQSRLESIPEGAPPRCRVILGDSTERRYLDNVQELTNQLLYRISSTDDLRASIAWLAAALQQWSDCEAVGIRLREGEDFPYYETRGFAAGHVETENSLCRRDAHGDLFRDGTGGSLLECTCGQVIMGRVDRSLPFFTPKGSFWTNCTTLFRAGGAAEKRRTQTVRLCGAEGYESMALVPIRSGDSVYGLLQFCDRRTDLFTKAFINMLERLADTLALALSRRESVEALRESELKYQQLFENMAEGVALHEVIKDETGKVVDARYLHANPACERLTGHGSGSMVGNTITEIVPDATPELIEAMGRVAETGVGIAFEYSVRKTGRHLLVRTFSPRPGLFANIFSDITDYRRTEKELREKQRLLLNIMDSTLDLIVVKDQDMRILMCNRAFASMLGKEPSELSGKTDIEKDEDRDPLRMDPWRGIGGIDAGDRRALGGEICHSSSEWIDERGEPRLFDSIKLPLRDESGQIFGLLGVSRDITEQNKVLSMLAKRELERESLTEELRNLNAYLLSVREEERREIALEIHDDLGQRLTAMGLNLHVIAAGLGARKARLRSEIEALIERNKESMAYVQSLASRLRPRLLDDLGLEPALRWLVKDLGKTGKPKLSLTCELGSSLINQDTSMAVFRIVQEALTNVLRHSRAEKAEVAVRTRGDSLEVGIRDDGIGIDSAKLDDSSSFGLLGIRERVLKLGGSLSLSGAGKKGASLDVSLPLPPRQDEHGRR
jgi:PAS domain S-box-containing protein